MIAAWFPAFSALVSAWSSGQAAGRGEYGISAFLLLGAAIGAAAAVTIVVMEHRLAKREGGGGQENR